MLGKFDILFVVGCRGYAVGGVRGEGVTEDGGEIIVASGPGRRSICTLNIHIHTYLYK